MPRTRFRWKIREFEAIRRSTPMRGRLRSEAQGMADAAGDGYEMRSGEGRTRSRAAVVTVTVRAMRSNAKRNTLVRVLNGARKS